MRRGRLETEKMGFGLDNPQALYDSVKIISFK